MPSPADWSDSVLAEFVELSVNIIRTVLDELATSLHDPISCLGKLPAPAATREHEKDKCCEKLGSYKCKIELLARTLSKLRHQTEFTGILGRHLNDASTALERALTKLRNDPVPADQAGLRAFYLSVLEELKTSFPSLDSAHHAARTKKEELLDLNKRYHASLAAAYKNRGIVCGTILSLVATVLLGYALNSLFASTPVIPNPYFVIFLGLLVGTLVVVVNWPLASSGESAGA